MTVRGDAGAVRWGYYLAAGVRGWVITRDESGLVLAAEITDANTYRLSQRPLVFALPHVRRVWPILKLQVEGAALTARLGPQES